MDPTGAPPFDLRHSAVQLVARLALAWETGWLPHEVLRQVRRRRSAEAERVAAAAIAAWVADQPLERLHPAWRRHLARVDLPQVGRDDRWWELPAVPGSSRMTAIVDAVEEVSWLPRLAVIVPTPGGHTPDWFVDGSPAADDPVLERVRRLLAKAESTTFPAEAEACVEKAHELMARHAIDAALLWDRHDRGDRPVAIRLPVDDPYLAAKANLLHVVARASRCRAVLHQDVALCTVVGFTPDVVATELLFTSLLVQAQSALQLELNAADPGSRIRSRAFRAAFLRAYAFRIGERLSAVTAQAEFAALDPATLGGVGGLCGEEDSTALVPVLAAREAAIDTAVDVLFGSLSRVRSRARLDGFGWERGRAAADRAELRSDLRPASSPRSLPVP